MIVFAAVVAGLIAVCLGTIGLAALDEAYRLRDVKLPAQQEQFSLTADELKINEKQAA